MHQSQQILACVTESYRASHHKRYFSAFWPFHQIPAWPLLKGLLFIILIDYLINSTYTVVILHALIIKESLHGSSTIDGGILTETVDVVCFSLESGAESGACPVLVVVTFCVPVGREGVYT